MRLNYSHSFITAQFLPHNPRGNRPENLHFFIGRISWFGDIVCFSNPTATKWFSKCVCRDRERVDWCGEGSRICARNASGRRWKLPCKMFRFRTYYKSVTFKWLRNGRSSLVAYTKVDLVVEIEIEINATVILTTRKRTIN